MPLKETLKVHRNLRLKSRYSRYTSRRHVTVMGNHQTRPHTTICEQQQRLSLASAKPIYCLPSAVVVVVLEPLGLGGSFFRLTIIARVTELGGISRSIPRSLVLVFSGNNAIFSFGVVSFINLKHDPSYVWPRGLMVLRLLDNNVMNRNTIYTVQKCRKIRGLGCVNQAPTRMRVTQPSPHIFLHICIVR